jgi:integrase
LGCPRQPNPFANLRTTASRGRKDITALSTGEVTALASAARRVHGQEYGAEVAALIILAAYSGMRRGKLAVLSWADVDFKAGPINVSKTLSADVEVLAPTNSKPRVIALPPIAANALRVVPRHLHRSRVFSTSNGKLLTRGNFHYVWQPRPRRCGQAQAALPRTTSPRRPYYVDVLGLHPTDAARQLGHSDAGQLLLSVDVHPDQDRSLERLHNAFKTTEQLPSVSDWRRHGGDAHA